METLIEKLSQFVTQVRYEDLPAKEIEWAKLALTDFIAVSYPGASMPVAQNVRAFLNDSPRKGNATLIGTGCRADAADAALFNGTASHSLDFDDVSWATIGHPTVCVAPTALASVQERGLDGKALLLSYIVGVEVMHQIARWTMPLLSEKGWHTTPVYGTFGAAVAACVVYGADKEQTAHALAIAASRSAGIRGNFGAQTKALHAGTAALLGLEAARLALHGVTGNLACLENQDGFAQCFAEPIAKEAVVDIGRYWDLAQNGLVFKQYPCCSGSHPTNDVWDAYLKDHPISYTDIKKIHAGVSLLGPRELSCHHPVNAVQAKFSLEYALASRVIFGPLTLASFTDEKVRDSRVQDLMSRIDMQIDPELARLGFIGTAPVRLDVMLTDGTTVHLENDLALGNSEKPLSKEVFFRKFESCLKTANCGEIIESSWEKLLNLETASSETVASLGACSADKQ